jgi:hypothetical protein
MASSDLSRIEAAELQVNPQFREIKKLKPVLRRLLPSRTQFAKIEELFNCAVDTIHDESNPMDSAHFSMGMIGEEDLSEDEDSDGSNYANRNWSSQRNLEAIGEEVTDSDSEEDQPFAHTRRSSAARQSVPDVSEEVNIIPSPPSLNDRISASRRSAHNICEVTHMMPPEPMISRLSGVRNSFHKVSEEDVIVVPPEPVTSRLSGVRNSFHKVSEEEVNVVPPEPVTSRLSGVRNSFHKVSEEDVNVVPPEPVTSRLSGVRNSFHKVSEEEVNVVPPEPVTSRLSGVRNSFHEVYEEEVNVVPPEPVTSRLSGVRNSFHGVSEISRNIPAQTAVPKSFAGKRNNNLQVRTQCKSSISTSAIAQKPLSMEGSGGVARKRNGSGFLMGNPMASPRGGSSDEETRDSSSSVNSIDRLPHGVDAFRKPKLDIFQSSKRR